MNKATYLRMICTGCGVTQKTRNWYNQAQQTRFTKKCHHCDPLYPKQIKKDNNNDVNLLRKTI
tara:strand:+ start:256 stop:444 length:189 start_codon:yes stop_codon:yes gene_type:complete